MPIRIGKWIKGWKLGSWFKRTFKNLDAEVKKLLPVAIAITEQIKKVVDSGVANVITDLIPGTIDDTIKTKAREILPIVLLKLRAADSIEGIEDPEERALAIVASLKFSSDEQRDAFWHSFASLFISMASDGKISWSDAVILSETYYRFEHKGSEE